MVWLVVSAATWFSAGGTLGGPGASASTGVDWGRLSSLRAVADGLPVKLAGAVPLVWAGCAYRNATPGRSRQRRGVVLGAVALVVTGWMLAEPVALIRARAQAVEPDAAVVAALTRAAGGQMDRELDTDAPPAPWIVTYRSGPLPFAQVAAVVPADSGRWSCQPGNQGQWLFQRAATADDGTSLGLVPRQATFARVTI